MRIPTFLCLVVLLAWPGASIISAAPGPLFPDGSPPCSAVVAREPSAVPGSLADSQVAGQVGGPVQGLALAPGYAYLGVGLRLVVLDVSTAGTALEIGATAPLGDMVRGVAVNGPLAYVAAGTAGLYVVDLSDRRQPVIVGHYDGVGYAEGLAIAGKSVLLADGPSGLRVLDVSEPTHPRAIASAYATHYAFGVAVAGRTAYIAAAGAGVLAVDISNPALPVEDGVIKVPGYVYGVAADGGQVYAASSWAGLQIADGSARGAGAVLGSYHSAGQAFGVTVADDRAYVADAYNGLRIVDVADPAHPRELGGYAILSGHAGGVAVAGQTAYVADRVGGLRAFDVSNPGQPQPCATYSSLSVADAVALAGGYAYIAAGPYGLRVVDLAEPGAPRDIGGAAIESTFSNFATAVAIQGQYALVCNVFNLYVADIAVPAQPAWVTQAEIGGHGACRAMTVAGGIAFIAEESGLRLMDVADPTHPAQLGYVQLQRPDSPFATAGIAVSGTVAYVGREQAGLDIVDVSDRHSLRYLGNFSAPGNFLRGAAIRGSLAYVADYSFGLRIIDVSSPSDPVEVGSYPLPGQNETVMLVGSLAYVAAGSSGVHVLDISQPTQPRLLASLDTPGSATDVATAVSQVYVADLDGGLAVLAPPSGVASGQAQRVSVPASSWDTQSAAPLSRFVARHAYPAEVGSIPTAAADLPMDVAPRVAGGGCTVHSLADSGTGTLRACLEGALSGTAITFDPTIFPPSHPVSIALLSALPSLDAGNITIDASNAGVILSGSEVSGLGFGLLIPSNGNRVRGLQIVDFTNNGIHITGADNIIGGDRSLGSGPMGQGNVIRGNQGFGIAISGEGATGNRVIGNLIGVDPGGTAAWPNTMAGVFIMDAASANTIGGTSTADRNIISSNGASGVAVQFHGHNNLIAGNYIGTDIHGQAALGNGGSGVMMAIGGLGNRIQGNLISGNQGCGVILADWGTSYNTVVGNLIGTDASGTSILENQQWAVFVGGQGASFNRVGGTRPEEMNVMASSRGIIEVAGPAEGNLILGNRIGVDASGSQPMGTPFSAVDVSPLSRVIIGGATAAEGNVIHSSGLHAIVTGSDATMILGNVIGTNAAGTALFGTHGGIWVRGGQYNILQGNTIGRSDGVGIQIDSGNHNSIRQNSIYSNTVAGIQLAAGGNAALPAPEFTLSAGGVTGATCAGCTVEIYSDAGAQGRSYVGSTVADAGGAFAYPPVCPLAFAHLVATATTPQGDTSQFSAPGLVPWDCSAPNPTPVIASLNPITTHSGSPTFPLAISGSGFVVGSTVHWNGEAIATTWGGSSSLTATVPSRLVTRPGLASVVVVSPTPGGGGSSAATFEIQRGPEMYLPLLRRG